jgi:hypothetical protein
MTTQNHRWEQRRCLWGPRARGGAESGVKIAPLRVPAIAAVEEEGRRCRRRGCASAAEIDGVMRVLPRLTGAAAKLSNWWGQWTLPYQENNSGGRRWRRLILWRRRAGGEGLVETHASCSVGRWTLILSFLPRAGGAKPRLALRWSMTARATMVRGGVGKQDMASDLVLLCGCRYKEREKEERIWKSRLAHNAILGKRSDVFFSCAWLIWKEEFCRKGQLNRSEGCRITAGGTIVPTLECRTKKCPLFSLFSCERLIVQEAAASLHLPVDMHHLPCWGWSLLHLLVLVLLLSHSTGAGATAPITVSSSMMVSLMTTWPWMAKLQSLMASWG